MKYLFLLLLLCSPVYAQTQITTNGIKDGVITQPKLSATGTQDATTYLRGDYTWQAISGIITGLVTGPGSSTNTALVRWNGTTGQVVEDSSFATLGNSGALTITGVSPASTSSTPGTNASANITFVGAAGGATTNTTAGTGGSGSSVIITAGAGGAATGTASGTNTAGSPGSVTLTGGSGGLASNGATNVPTSGGTVTINGGPAAAMIPSAGGQININSGAGTSVGSGGAGGNLVLTAGNAQGDSSVNHSGGIFGILSGNSVGDSAGGPVNITCGNGGAGTSTTGAIGGSATVRGGVGGNGSATGGAGGFSSITGGTGGVGGGGGAGTTPGAGGIARVLGGAAASSAGSAGGGCQVTAAAGTSTGSGGAGGAVMVSAGNAGGDNSVNLSGGNLTLIAGTSKGSSVGGVISITAGVGGVGINTGTIGATGGALTFAAGTGGANTTGGAGGNLTLNGGIQGAGGSAGGGAVIIRTAATTSLANSVYVAPTGNVYFGTVTSPTATIHIKAGTATASTAPLKFTTGTLLSTPESGAMEFASSHLYFTISSTRFQLDQQGTVTSVGLSLPSIFTVSGSPVTTTGTLTGVLATQSANTIFAGPASGSAATPTFRSLVSADIPALPAHIISSGSTPTIAIGSDTVSASISGNDTAGTITLTGQLVGATGTLCTVTFNAAFGSTPKAVTITPATLGASLCQAYVSALSTTAYTLSNATATTASVSLVFYYFVIG